MRSEGAERIAAERQRQVEAEGWTPEHDAEHGPATLVWAAVCYAAPERVYVMREYASGPVFLDPWPWEDGWDKRKRNGSNVPTPAPTEAERLRELEKAGALIAAEIDRMLAEPKVVGPR